MKIFSFCIFVSLLFLVGGCTRGPRLTFQGGVLPAEVKTLQIETFFNDVAAGPANLGLTFSERTREYFLRNTRLSVVNSNADLTIGGSIVGYEVAPIAPTAGTTAGIEQIAAQQRLSITIKVIFASNNDKIESFDQNFSFFLDFDNSKTLSQVEPELIPKIFEQIIRDIFNKTVANW